MKSILLIITLSFLCIQCRQEEDQDQLPPITQIGKNTAGCLVNGNPLRARGELSKIFTWGPPISLSYIKDHNFTLFFTDQKQQGLPSVYIAILNQTIEEGQEYKLGENLKDDSKVYSYAEYSNDLHYYTTNSINTGKIKITYVDNNKYIISGTFEFEAVDQTGNKISITKGRFDATY